MGFDEIPSLEKKQEMLRNMLRRETLRKMTSEKHEKRLEKHEMLLDMIAWLHYPVSLRPVLGPNPDLALHRASRSSSYGTGASEHGEALTAVRCGDEAHA
eukprot:scaffold58540_cov66-Phaeocystis_antarctica.AAC.5